MISLITLIKISAVKRHLEAYLVQSLTIESIQFIEQITAPQKPFTKKFVQFLFIISITF